MGIFDNLDHLLKQAAGGNAPEPEVHAAYDQVAQAVPQNELADGLTHAFKSDQTPPFEKMVADLFARSTPEQKAGMAVWPMVDWTAGRSHKAPPSTLAVV